MNTQGSQNRLHVRAPRANKTFVIESISVLGFKLKGVSTEHTQELLAGYPWTAGLDSHLSRFCWG